MSNDKTTIGPNSKNTKCGVTTADGSIWGVGLPETAFSVQDAGGDSRGFLALSYGSQTARIGLTHFSEAFEQKARKLGLPVGTHLGFYTPQVAEGLNISDGGHNWHTGPASRKPQHRASLELPMGWTVKEDGQFWSFQVDGLEVARLFRFLTSDTRYDSVMGSSSPVGALLLQSASERRADKLRLKKAELAEALERVAKLEKEVAKLSPKTRTRKASK